MGSNIIFMTHEKRQCQQFDDKWGRQRDGWHRLFRQNKYQVHRWENEWCPIHKFNRKTNK